METKVAYFKSAGLVETRVPAGLLPDAAGHYHWTAVEACHRCGGLGGARHWPGWTCYECGGAAKMPYGHEAVTRERAEKLQLNAERRAAKARAGYLVKVAAADALLLPRLGVTWSQLADLAHWFREEGAAHDIARKVCHGATSKAKVGMVPSEAQWKVLDDLMAWFDGIAAREDAKPAPVILPAGRQMLTGTFVTVRWHETQFGRTVKGLLVATRDGGEAKVWMTAPGEAYRLESGDPEPTRLELELAVTIEPATDPGFHFGTRPAKVKVLDTEDNMP